MFFYRQNESVRTDGALLVAALEEKLAGLKEDISRLDAAHLGLLAGVKGCCKNDSTLALMVKAAVQEQLAAVSDILHVIQYINSYWLV